MKKLSILLILNLICFSAYTQNDNKLNLDSIEKQYTIAHIEGNQKNIQKAAQDCQNIIKNNHDSLTLSKSYALFGQILSETRNDSAALKYLILAIDGLKINLGADAYETLKTKKCLAETYGNLGDLDIELKDSKQILVDFKKNEVKNSLLIADLYNTIGINQGLRNKRNEERNDLLIAFKILENYKPVDDFHKLQAQYLLANVYNSLSQSYAYSLDYETSIKYARKSLQISEKIFPKNPERSAPMVALARGIYAFENKCDSAIYYLDNAITLLEKNNLYGTEMWLSYRSYKVNILARCGKKNEAKILAKNTAETLTNINDTVTPEKANSIILAQALTLNQNADIEFMAKEALLRQEAIITKQEQDKKNAIALEEINRQRNIRNITFTGFVMVLLFSFVVIGQRNKIAKDKKLIEALEGEVDHRVSNSLRVVKRMIEVAEREVENSFNLDFLKNRVNASILVHESLYKNKLKGKINMQEYLQNLCTALQETYDPERNIKLYINSVLDIETIVAERFGLIINELMTNSYKYAFPSKRDNSQINIEIIKSSKIITLHYYDNGIGLKDGKITNSFGQKFITKTCQSLRAENRFYTKNGAHFELIISL